MRSRSLLLAAAGLLVASLGMPSSATAAAAEPAGRFLVSFKQDANVEGKVKDLTTKHGLAKPSNLYKHAFRGFAGALSKGQLKALRNDPSVVSIQADERIELAGQAQPTGVRRIG